jgi:hypothetical protein
MTGRVRVACALLAAVLALAGCAIPPAPGDGSAERAAESSEGRRLLERAVAAFEQGRFAESTRLLQEAPELLAAPPEVRVQALKWLAFNHCVGGRRAACRRAFDALLVLDPAFVLAPAESGHPAWGAEFERARAATARPARTAAH